MRPALRRAARRYFQRRAIRAGVSWRSRRTIACRRSSIRPARAAGRFRCSSPAPSCNISAARPASSIRARSAHARRGRGMAVLADGGSRPDGRSGRTLPPLRTASRSIMRIARYTDEVNRLYGVMNKRLADARISGRPLFDRRHGVCRLGAACRAAGPRPAQFPHLNAGSKRSARARPSSALSPSASRRRPRSTCAIRKVRAVLFGQRAR